MLLPVQTRDVQVAPAYHDGPTSAPSPPTLAKLWSVCDAICCALNVRLRGAGATPQVTIRQSQYTRRYSATSPDGEHFIAIVPLLPAARGGVSCGAYIGASESVICTYVEPVVESDRQLWLIPAEGTILDTDDIVDLFSRVFGALSEMPPAQGAERAALRGSKTHICGHAWQRA